MQCYPIVFAISSDIAIGFFLLVPPKNDKVLKSHKEIDR